MMHTRGIAFTVMMMTAMLANTADGINPSFTFGTNITEDDRRPFWCIFPPRRCIPIPKAVSYSQATVLVRNSTAQEASTLAALSAFNANVTIAVNGVGSETNIIEAGAVVSPTTGHVLSVSNEASDATWSLCFVSTSGMNTSVQETINNITILVSTWSSLDIRNDSVVMFLKDVNVSATTIQVGENQDFKWIDQALIFAGHNVTTFLVTGNVSSGPAGEFCRRCEVETDQVRSVIPYTVDTGEANANVSNTICSAIRVSSGSSLVLESVRAWYLTIDDTAEGKLDYVSLKGMRSGANYTRAEIVRSLFGSYSPSFNGSNSIVQSIVATGGTAYDTNLTVKFVRSGIDQITSDEELHIDLKGVSYSQVDTFTFVGNEVTASTTRCRIATKFYAMVAANSGPFVVSKNIIRTNKTTAPMEIDFTLGSPCLALVTQNAFTKISITSPASSVFDSTIAATYAFICPTNTSLDVARALAAANAYWWDGISGGEMVYNGAICTGGCQAGSCLANEPEANYYQYSLASSASPATHNVTAGTITNTTAVLSYGVEAYVGSVYCNLDLTGETHVYDHGQLAEATWASPSCNATYVFGIDEIDDEITQALVGPPWYSGIVSASIAIPRKQCGGWYDLGNQCTDGEDCLFAPPILEYARNGNLDEITLVAEDRVYPNGIKCVTNFTNATNPDIACSEVSAALTIGLRSFTSSASCKATLVKRSGNPFSKEFVTTATYGTCLRVDNATSIDTYFCDIPLTGLASNSSNSSFCPIASTDSDGYSAMYRASVSPRFDLEGEIARYSVENITFTITTTCPTDTSRTYSLQNVTGSLLWDFASRNLSFCAQDILNIASVKLDTIPIWISTAGIAMLMTVTIIVVPCFYFFSSSSTTEGGLEVVPVKSWITASMRKGAGRRGDEAGSDDEVFRSETGDSIPAALVKLGTKTMMLPVLHTGTDTIISWYSRSKNWRSAAAATWKRRWGRSSRRKGEEFKVGSVVNDDAQFTQRRSRSTSAWNFLATADDTTLRRDGEAFVANLVRRRGTDGTWWRGEGRRGSDSGFTATATTAATITPANFSAAAAERSNNRRFPDNNRFASKFSQRPETEKWAPAGTTSWGSKRR